MNGITNSSYTYCIIAIPLLIVSVGSDRVYDASLFNFHSVKTIHPVLFKPSFLDIEEEEDEDEEETEFDGDLEDMMAENEKINDEFDKGTPGIDFLGVGYDSIFGNTLGGEDSLLDPGYRAPILNFEWRKNSQGYSPTLKALYPVNGWVRPVYSCGRSSKIEEMKNLDDMRSAFSASAELTGEVPTASFSASAKYKKEAENLASKQERIYLHTDMCIRYQAGIPLNIPWETTKQFTEAVEALRPVNNASKDKCSVNDLVDTDTKEECKELKDWMGFFQTFGTHYVHQITLGGKLVQTMKFSYEALKDLKTSGYDVDLAISAAMGAVKAGVKGSKSIDASKLDDVGVKTLTVIGGEMPNLPITDDDFAAWAKSVSAKPMPIGFAADCIKGLLKEELHDSYAIALYKYAEINGLTYETLMRVGGNNGGLMSEIKNGEQGTNINQDVNVEQCSGNAKILTGFSAMFKYDGSFLGIIPCKKGTKKCDVPRNKYEIHSVSWIICTIGLQPNLIQVTNFTDKKSEMVKASCPPGTVVQFGVKLLSRGDKLIEFENCERGLEFCEKQNKESDSMGIWIVCAPEVYLAEKINIVGGVTAGETVAKCGENEKIIAGTALKFMEHPGKNMHERRTMTIDKCEKYVGSCKSECTGECITTFAMVLCSDIGDIAK